MKSLLQQLENNEAILLMYLADELPAEDRREVEQMLASDASLRRSLDELRALQHGCQAQLDELHRIMPPPVAQPVAVRNLMRTIRQWQVNRLVSPASEAPGRQLRFPWWSYPLTMAASVLIAFLVWWGYHPSSVEDQQAGKGEGQFVENAEHDQLVNDMERSLREPVDEGLQDAEDQLAALQMPSDDIYSISFGIFGADQTQ